MIDNQEIIKKSSRFPFPDREPFPARGRSLAASRCWPAISQRAPPPSFAPTEAVPPAPPLFHRLPCPSGPLSLHPSPSGSPCLRFLRPPPLQTPHSCFAPSPPVTPGTVPPTGPTLPATAHIAGPP